MSIIKNPELKGILGLILIIALVGFLLMATTGKLEQWFGITLLSGPQAFDKIVFVSDRSGTSQIYIMNPDGSDQKVLTKETDISSAPAISPAANRITYVAKAGNAQQVFAVGVDGGSSQQLSTASGPKAQPSYRPDSKMLSFIASGKVYAAELEGANPDVVLPIHREIQEAMLARGALPAYSQYAWAPDGQAMAGVTKDENGSDVLVYLPNPEGEAFKMPFALKGQASHITGISWAAKAPFLAVSAVIGEQGFLAIFNTEQQKVKPLIRIDAEFGQPCLSPDGATLVVPATLPGKKAFSGLLRLEVSTNQGGPIASGDFQNPSFSPDGSRLLAVSVDKHGKKRDIISIDLSSGQVTKLTKDGGSFDAVWTPGAKK